MKNKNDTQLHTCRSLLRQEEIKSNFQRVIFVIFDEARRKGYTHKAILDAMSEKVWSMPKARNLPRHARESLRGYSDACMDYLWTQVEWVYEIDNVVMSAFSDEWKCYVENNPGAYDKLNNEGRSYHRWITAKKPLTETTNRNG